MRRQIEKVNASNLQQIINSLSRLSAWYRDVLDEELIAAWKKDGRSNLPDLVKSFADAPLATAIVDFSWRQQRSATFMPDYEPMLEMLIGHYGDSAKPVFDDLLGSIAAGRPLELSPPEAETLCRILLNLPDIRDFRANALRILPHYIQVTKRLLDSDLASEDRETRYRASRWIADLPNVDSALGRQTVDGTRAPAQRRVLAQRSASQNVETSGAVLRPLSASMVDSSASTDGNANALIEFINRSRGAVDLYWIDYNGKRSLMLQGLRAGGSIRARTAVGHLWLAVVAGTGSAARNSGATLQGFQAITPNNNYDPAKRDVAIVTNPDGSTETSNAQP
jgi:hypothetical protein